jgi:hypothetical protein
MLLLLSSNAEISFVRRGALLLSPATVVSILESTPVNEEGYGA